MQCIKCGIELKHTKKFCPYCGNSFHENQSEKLETKEKIDKAMEEKDFSYLWNLFEMGSAPYAEYIYERFILVRANKIDTPSDFKIFINKIKKKAENENLFAKYLYGKAMTVTFREHGLFDGLAAFMGDKDKYREGVKFVKEAAINGQTSAEWTMGGWLWNGNEDANISVNHRDAFKYVFSAANKGHPMAMMKLGEIYNEGMTGVERDYQKAKMWIKAAEYFDCKTKKVEIYKQKSWIHEKEVEEIVEFYELGENQQKQNDIYSIQMDFSQVPDFYNRM